MRRIILTAFLIVCISHAVAAVELEYPETQRIDHSDVYHGIEITDVYRWLEEDVRESKRVGEWVEAQNKVTFGYLHSLGWRDKIKERLTEVWDYEKYSVPQKVGGRYAIGKNDGLQNHYVIYVMDSLDGERRILLDPNKWSKDGTTALGGTSFSEDGRFVAYAIQESGSDWRTWKVRDIETGKDTPEVLKYLKFTDVAWDSESRGFFYGKYPDPVEGQEFTSLNKKMKVMYHRLGTKQEEDVVFYYRPDHPEWSYEVEVTDDGRYVILTIWVGTDDKYRVMYKDLDERYAMAVDLITEFENDYSFIDNDGLVFFFRTDFDAPNGRVIAIDTRKPQRENYKEIIGEAEEPLESVDLVGNLFICKYLKDVTTQVKVYTADGRHLRDVELTGLGTASGFSGKGRDSETFYSFQSFITPPTIYRYDILTGESAVVEQAKVSFDPDKYVTKQVFYESKDGTRVPMFITHKKGIRPGGASPTLLYGYGGFNISIRPSFSALRLVWMEMGGIYAVANIRGGGEYGQKWHEAGKKMAKQNVFDDFIAAAEYLIKEKYTSPKKLVILGGSNGGLLVGACMTQRPDLFGAAVCAVGVMDMLRFDEFTAGRFWVDEYGSAKGSKEMFEYLKGYSPYHNLKPGVRYPATLITTADTDDRVVPGHSFKYAAQLQRCHAGKEPVLIRIESRAGHGSGRPTSMIIEEQADIYAFCAKNLGMVE